MIYIIIVISLVGLLIYFYATSSKGKRLNEVKSEKIGQGQHGNASFLSQKEFEKEFIVESRASRKRRGLILGYTQAGDFILDDSDKNLQIIGPPGSGKSVSFYEPNIAYNLDVHNNTKGKEGYNIFTIDLKGDQTEKFAQKYKDNGYNVTIINFRNVFNSDGYNPMGLINKYMDIAKKYEINTKEYIINYSKAERYAKILANGIVASVENPNSSSASKFFDDASSGLITGMILLASEYGINATERSLVSVFELIMEANEYEIEDEIPTSKLVPLLLKVRNKKTRTKYHVAPTVNADIRTSRNVNSSALQTMLDFMNLETEQILIRENKILDNLEEYVDKPTILFLILPDEDETKDFFASLLTRTIYNNLIEIAQKNYQGKLPRQWLALEDEAGNFPPVKKKDRIMTAVRSRNVKVVSAYQNDHQITKVYGDKMSAVINAGYQMVLTAALSPKDTKAKKDLSDRAGKYTIKSASVTSGSSRRDGNLWGSNSNSTTYNMLGKNLIEINETSELQVGEWLLEKVNLQGMIKTKLKMAKDIWSDIKQQEYNIPTDIQQVYPLTFEILENRFKPPIKVPNYDSEKDYLNNIEI